MAGAAARDAAAHADQGLREADRRLEWLRTGADALGSAGPTAETTTFSTADPAGDLTALAEEWAASHAVVVDERDAAALEAAGVEVTRAGSAAPVA